MAFCLTGFICGVAAMRRNRYFHFMLFVTLYFVAVAMAGQMWVMGDKLRVSTTPFIAIISAYGWVSLWRHCEESRQRRDDEAISKKES